MHHDIDTERRQTMEDQQQLIEEQKELSVDDELAFKGSTGIPSADFKTTTPVSPGCAIVQRLQRFNAG